MISRDIIHAGIQFRFGSGKFACRVKSRNIFDFQR